MRCINFPLSRTGYIHKLSTDYLTANPRVGSLYAFEPSMAGMAEAIEKRKQYPVNRAALQQVLEKQYHRLQPDFFDQAENKAVTDNIRSLTDENTFTITTGHQLNIFTGPLYYIYKLVSVIKYANELSKAFPGQHFVPVYWMATEDHDFEEINHFYLWGKKYTWETEAGGAVGRMDPRGMETLITEIEKLSINGPNRNEIIDLLKGAYLQHDTLADATRYLVHHLFKSHGLVVIDADDAALKASFIPVIEKDIFRNTFFNTINASMAGLEKEYKLPVSPREINFFHLGDKTRGRIVFNGKHYVVAEGSKTWNEEELRAEIHESPQNFSPNVVLRPMYQETILPNLCYVGGGGEIAYWLELKSGFEAAGIFYPQILVRDSALFVGKKTAKDLEQFKLQPENLFLSKDDLMFAFYEANMLEHPAEKDAALLLDQYESLRTHLQGLPGDLVGNIVKQMNLQVKEVRRWKNEVHNKQLELQEKNVTKLEKLYASFYPDGELQERHDNFIPFYALQGQEWIQMMYDEFNPLLAVCHIFVEE